MVAQGPPILKKNEARKMSSRSYINTQALLLPFVEVSGGNARARPCSYTVLDTYRLSLRSMATNKRKKKAVQRTDGHEKKGRGNNSDTGAGVDRARKTRQENLKPLKDTGDELDGFLLDLPSADDEPFIIATQNTQKTQITQDSPAHTRAEDSTVVIDNNHLTPSEDSTSDVEGGGGKAEKDEAQNDEAEKDKAEEDKAENDEAEEDKMGGEKGKNRCRWSDDRLLALVKQVTHWKPIAPGISNKLRSERWKKVINSLQGNALFQTGVSIESAKQQLRKTLKEGKALEREDARQTGPGDNGQYDELQRARIELTQTMVAQKEMLDQATSSQMEKKLSQGQQMRAMYESGQGAGSGLRDGSKRAESPSLSMAMAGAGQHVQAMQGQLANVATLIKEKAANSSTTEVFQLLREELKEGRQLQMQMQTALMDLLKSWGPPRNNS